MVDELVKTPITIKTHFRSGKKVNGKPERETTKNIRQNGDVSMITKLREVGKKTKIIHDVYRNGKIIHHHVKTENK